MARSCLRAAAITTRWSRRRWPRSNIPAWANWKSAKGLEKAAQNFVAKAYNKAIDECNKTIEKGKDEAAVADAQFIIERCNAEGAKLRARADKAKEEKRYLDAFADLETLSNGFKGMENGDAAANELKELKKDKDVKREVDAANNLIKLMENVGKMKTKTEKALALRNFSKQKSNEGTRAAAMKRSQGRRRRPQAEQWSRRQHRQANAPDAGAFVF